MTVDEKPTPLALLPFYVLVDVSFSMLTEDNDGSTGIDAVNKIAPAVFGLFREAPSLRDRARFGIVDFAGGASTPLALCDPMGGSNAVPTLTARQDGTSYAAAFKAMRTRIEDDVATLKADENKVYRPAVFFLTDGEPTDRPEKMWRDAFDELVGEGNPQRPNFIPFGIRDARKDVLDPLARYRTPLNEETGKRPDAVAFMARDGVSATDAIEKMVDLLLQSILASDINGSNAGQVVMPTPADLQDDDDDIFI